MTVKRYRNFGSNSCAVIERYQQPTSNESPHYHPNSKRLYSTTKIARTMTQSHKKHNIHNHSKTQNSSIYSFAVIRASLCTHPPYFVGTPPPVGGLPPRWTGPPLRSVALSAAGGVTTDPPLGRCPCREPPQTLSLLLANRHGRFEIADFHYENQSRSQAPTKETLRRGPSKPDRTRICGAST